mmetsp:Transcript_25264/g.44852  ORF Transcript_25264/g.44852 Transcript_25264/m.44852 type:complete len:303 (+) Transcript_25264:28-936(+)|eukprot:CAMPEP_0205927134 /NCGR_PEP_ID=MMETSP1325-20131115/21979_1 /ASSEMBLY_ACC=CAM_ASM_000708 /TAXON_ID=236786 /ORGANISM="Florenciella sp., Strain RCC1007" /LENGTH=302 /DNA_ID=CAMNT_0053295963 /DNA_START=28 /DNA_END=936 /DNA_ORIENTATION=+
MPEANFIVDFIAGGTSGAIAKTCTAPIERVKLIIQTQDANPKIISGEVPRYTGIGNCFVRVYQEQGLGAFWRGNFVNVLRYFPTQAFNFAFKDSIKALIVGSTGKPKSFFGKLGVNVASGGLAGAGSLCIVYPLDYARTRLASDVGSGKRAFNGLGDCLMKTATGPAGPLGLYAGFGVSVIGIIPFRGTYFGVNDTLNQYNPYQKQKDIIGIFSKFVCAQTAALCAAYASYPFDTVRRRLQMQAEKPQEEWVYKGTADCFAKIAKDEGMGALFKGAGANALRTVGSALVLVMYGEIKDMLSK